MPGFQSHAGYEARRIQDSDGCLAILELAGFDHLERTGEPNRLHRKEFVGFTSSFALLEVRRQEDVNSLISEPWRGVHRVQVPHRSRGAPRLFAQLAVRAGFRALARIQPS